MGRMARRNALVDKLGNDVDSAVGQTIAGRTLRDLLDELETER